MSDEYYAKLNRAHKTYSKVYAQQGVKKARKAVKNEWKNPIIYTPNELLMVDK